MTAKLRITRRDGRGTTTHPYCLIDRNSNALISVHATHADAARAHYTIHNVSVSSDAYGYSAAELSEVCATVCERQHSGRSFGTLFGVQQAKLIAEVQRELRSRRRFF